MNPFIQIYGLPDHISHKLLSRGQTQVSVNYNIISNFTSDKIQNEEIILDGETSLLQLVVRRGLGKGLIAGLVLPQVHHSGGYLDSFILGWHETLGLRTLGRDRVDNDQLKFLYRNGSGAEFQLDKAESGLGDIMLFMQYQNTHINQSVTYYDWSIKLPTGEVESLNGSGAMDIAFLVSRLSTPRLILDRSFNWFGRAGVLVTGKSEILPELQKRLIGFGAVGFTYEVIPRLSFKLQFDVHTPFYHNTRIRQLESYGLIWSTGLTWQFNNNWGLDLAISEDELAYDISPDIGFHIQLRYSSAK